MTRSFDLLHPGVSRFHTVGLVVPLLAAIFPFMIAPWVRSVEKQHHIFAALLLGAATACFAYVLLRYVPILKDEQYTLNKAVLLGLLASEVLIFTIPRGDWDDRFISPTMLVFFMFMYLFGIAEIQKD